MANPLAEFGLPELVPLRGEEPKQTKPVESNPLAEFGLPPLVPMAAQGQEETIDPSMQEPKQPKVEGSIAGDMTRLYGVGSNRLLSNIGTIAGYLPGVDAENALTRIGEQGAEYWQEGISDEYKTRQREMQERVKAVDGEWSQLGATYWEYLNDGYLLAGAIMESAPSMVVGGGAGRLVAGVSKSIALGTGVAVGTGAGLQGADVAGEAYKDLLKLPDKLWNQNPEFQELSKTVGAEEAKKQIAEKLSQQAGAAAGGISVGAQFLPFGRVFEKAMVGGKTAGGKIVAGAKGLAGETLSEGLEEGGGKVAGNLAVGQVDPNQAAFEGAGQAAGAGAAVGGVVGGGSGVLSADPTLTPEAIREEQDRRLELFRQELDKKKLEEEPITPMPELEKTPDMEDDYFNYIVEEERKANETIARLANDEVLEDIFLQDEDSVGSRIMEERRGLDDSYKNIGDFGQETLFSYPTPRAMRNAAANPEMQKALVEGILASDGAKMANGVPKLWAIETAQLITRGDLQGAFGRLQSEIRTSRAKDEAKVRNTLREMAGAVGETVAATGLSELPLGESKILGFGYETNFMSKTDKQNRRIEAKRLQVAKLVADNFLQRYAPNTRLAILPHASQTAPGSQKNFGEVSFVDAQNFDGTTERVFSIYLNNERIAERAKDYNLSEDAAIAEVMHHELGHLLSFSEFKRADKLTQIAILNDYRRWLRDRNWDESSAEFLSSWRAPFMLEGLAYGSDQTHKAKTHFGPGIDYWYSFNEFIAESVAKSMYKQGPMQSEIAKPFYQKIWNQMVQMYENLVKKWPELKKTYPGVDAWLDSLRFRNERLRLEMQDMAKTEKTLGSKALIVGDEKMLEQTANRITAAAKIPKKSPTAKTIRSVLGHIPKYRAHMKQIYTIPQLEREFKNIPGMVTTVEGIRNWWAAKGTWVSRAVDTLEYAYQLIERDKQKLKAFEQFAFMMTLQSDKLQRKNNPSETQKLIQQSRISPEGLDVWKRMEKDFSDALNKLFEVLIKDAQKALANDPVAYKMREAALLKQKKEMLNRDYFPLMRFGRYYTKVKAEKPVTVDGREFKTGEIVWFGTNENKKKQASEWAWIQKNFSSSDFDISSGYLDETEGGINQMPDIILDKIAEMSIEEAKVLKPDASPEELATFITNVNRGIQNVKLEYSPGSSFKKRLTRRKGTPGFSSDALRSYAAFMQNFGNFIARAEHRHQILDGLDQMRDFNGHAKRKLGPDESVRLDKLRQYLADHYEYLMTPQNEWANIRSAVTIWYLGFVPRSAFVNLTQPFIATQPWLEERYGFTQSIAQMAKATKDLRAAWTRGKKGSVEADLVEALEKGYEAEFLEESLASELGGYAEGSNLQRILPDWLPGGKDAGVNRNIRQWQRWSMAMFQGAERVNRLTTFMASYRLHRNKLLGDQKLADLAPTDAERIKQEAFVLAREAVEITQGEYARWARPNLMKGKASILFLFKLYQQHMGYLVLKDPAGRRVMRNMFALGGILGLPFAQNVIDIMQFFLQAMEGDDEKVDVKKEMRLAAEETFGAIDGAPDLILRGASHNGFGALFPFDLHMSLSLGTMVPGTEALNRSNIMSDTYSTAGHMLEAAGGPVASLFFNAWKAAGSDEGDQWKRWERTMPAALKAVSRATRTAVTGEEIDAYNLATLAEYDAQDPMSLYEIGGMAGGFTPVELTRKQEMRWEAKQTARFYQARRAKLYSQYYVARVTKDREGIADVRKAIDEYNKNRPEGVRGIGPEDLSKSFKSRYVKMRRTEMGLAPTKGEQRIYSDIMESYPDWTWEEPSR